jgi:hypothetical protein
MQQVVNDLPSFKIWQNKTKSIFNGLPKSLAKFRSLPNLSSARASFRTRIRLAIRRARPALHFPRFRGKFLLLFPRRPWPYIIAISSSSSAKSARRRAPSSRGRMSPVLLRRREVIATCSGVARREVVGRPVLLRRLSWRSGTSSFIFLFLWFKFVCTYFMCVLIHHAC